MNVSILGMPKMHALRITEPESVFPKRIRGDGIWVVVHDGDYHIARLWVADGVLELGTIAKPRTLDVAQLRRAVDTGVIVGSIPKNARVRIRELGSFRVEEEHGAVDPREQIGEVNDLLDAVNDRPDSIQRCRRAYEKYVDDPTFKNRDALRETYEAVPEHMRMYVGTMDTKDVAVRMILYGDDQIETWSHRIVARAQADEELPTIMCRSRSGSESFQPCPRNECECFLTVGCARTRNDFSIDQACSSAGTSDRVAARG